MTDLHIRVDAAQAIGLMGRISDNFPRARTWALNRTAEEVNIALQREAQGRMLFRGQPGRRVLNLYAPTKIPPFLRATDQRPYVTPVFPENAGKLLRPYEEGGWKTVERTGRVPAIPTKAIRPWPGASIPLKFYPTNLWPETRMGANPARPLKSGKPRRSKSYREVKPFIIDPAKQGPGPKWGIYQRVGAGRGRLRMLWAFKLATRQPDLLDTYATSKRVVAQQWPVNMVGMFRNLVRLNKTGKASLLDLTV